jgi:hypothetical protein
MAAQANVSSNTPLHRQDRNTPAGDRPADHLSASDEDAPSRAIDTPRSSPPKAPFDVFTPKGFKPYYPPGPEPVQSSELLPDNPLNPRGGPSLSLPQQATPLTSEQGAMSIEDMADPVRAYNIAMTQDGLAPDNPQNPRGTPDYIVEGITDPDAETQIHTISPSTTPVSNTPITLTVTGIGFDPSAKVTVDGAEQATTVASANRLTAEYTPNTAGQKQITVDGCPAKPLTVTTEGTDA